MKKVIIGLIMYAITFNCILSFVRNAKRANEIVEKSFFEYKNAFKN